MQNTLKQEVNDWVKENLPIFSSLRNADDDKAPILQRRMALMKILVSDLDPKSVEFVTELKKERIGLTHLTGLLKDNDRGTVQIAEEMKTVAAHHHEDPLAKTAIRNSIDNFFKFQPELEKLIVNNKDLYIAAINKAEKLLKEEKAKEVEEAAKNFKLTETGKQVFELSSRPTLEETIDEIVRAEETGKMRELRPPADRGHGSVKGGKSTSGKSFSR